MANTFSSNVVTQTGAHGASSDMNTPVAGSLSLGAMTSLTALGGTTGTNVELIHGDEWNQIEGNLTENVLKNHIFYVKLNETYTVNTNLTQRVNGTTNDTRVGVDNRTNLQPRNDVFLHTRSETHYQPEHREQKTEDHDFAESLLEFKEKHFEYNPLKIDIKNLSFEFNWPLNFEKHLLDCNGSIFSMEGSAFEVEMKEIKTSLGALATEIKGGKVKAAAAHLKAIAGNINAGIALNADSPFG